MKLLFAETKEGMEPVRGLLRTLLLLLCVVNALSRMHSSRDGKSAMKSKDGEDETEKGTRWAVLIAGSSGYGNYRHQVLSFTETLAEIVHPSPSMPASQPIFVYADKSGLMAG